MTQPYSIIVGEYPTPARVTRYESLGVALKDFQEIGYNCEEGQVALIGPDVSWTMNFIAYEGWLIEPPGSCKWTQKDVDTFLGSLPRASIQFPTLKGKADRMRVGWGLVSWLRELLETKFGITVPKDSGTHNKATNKIAFADVMLPSEHKEVLRALRESYGCEVLVHTTGKEAR